MSKESFYFSHDYNSRTDDKIKNLIRKHGMAGYGVFWCIIEDLYNNANALRTDYDGIAYDLRTDVEIVKSVINDFDLFSFDNGSFGSTSIERRLDERNEKSEKARQSAFKRWDKIKTDAIALRTHSDSNAIKERKGKEIKEKKEKNKYAEFVFLALSEYEKLIEQHGLDYTTKFIEKLNNYKGANGKKYQSDYLAILNWVVDEVKKENKLQTSVFDKYLKK